MRKAYAEAVQISRTGPSAKVVNNRILLAIPESEYLMLRPHLKFQSLSHQYTLHDPNKERRFAYFLNSAVVSLTIETREGKTVEVGVVGNNGIVGVPSTVGLNRTQLHELVQIAGDAFSIKVAALQNVLASAPLLRARLNQYAVLQSLQMAQTAACNRLHGVEQRLARWLLSVQARSASDSIVITHDFLAAMLGTDRPSVSLAAGNLQRRQIIEYKRGALTVLDRRKLEKSACECYAVMEQLEADSEAP